MERRPLTGYPGPKYEKQCADCGHAYRAIASKWCDVCTLANYVYRTIGAGQLAASKAVNREIKHGRLVPPDFFNCVDCGAQAQIYEHRDYNKPLDVVPTCRPCNGLRGYAIPKKMTFDEFFDLVQQSRYRALTRENLQHIQQKHFKEQT